MVYVIMFYNEIYFQLKIFKCLIIVYLFLFYFVKGIGYWIYRVSNFEKNKFRQNLDDLVLVCMCNFCNGYL